MRNLRLDICYDGTRYRGWQRLPGKDDTIQGKIEKSVLIFLAKTDESKFTLQEEEIEECGWFSYEKALNTLNYENDKNILNEAMSYFIVNRV